MSTLMVTDLEVEEVTQMPQRGLDVFFPEYYRLRTDGLHAIAAHHAAFMAAQVALVLPEPTRDYYYTAGERKWLREILAQGGAK